MMKRTHRDVTDSSNFAEIRQNSEYSAKSSCTSRNILNTEPPAVANLFLRVDTAESGPSRMCYLPTPDPSARRKETAMLSLRARRSLRQQPQSWNRRRSPASRRGRRSRRRRSRGRGRSSREISGGRSSSLNVRCSGDH